MKSLLLVALLGATDLPQEPEAMTVAFTDGRTERVQVLGLDGDTARLKLFMFGGEMQVKRRLADLAPESRFRVELEATKPQSFEDHFKMAKKAADLGLLSSAGTEARAAVETLEGKPDAAAKTAEVRSWAAGAIEAMLTNAIAADDIQRAEHLVKILATRLADQRSEEQLAAWADKIDAMRTGRVAKKDAERRAKMDQKQKDDIEKRLKPIYAKIEAGDKAQRDAVAKSRNTSQSAQLAERAIDSYRAAWKDAQSLLEKYSDDQQLVQEVEGIGRRLHDDAIRAALHAANVLTVQSDYKGALDWTTRILKLDPSNDEAKQMQRVIQLSQAASWGWGWAPAAGGLGTVTGGPVTGPR
jgi:hypothetical protein